MSEFSQVSIKYFRAINEAFHWFVLYEFEIKEEAFFGQTDNIIIEELIGSNILGTRLEQTDKDGKQILPGIHHISRPYEFNKIHLSDFQYLKSRNEFDNWLIGFNTSDLEYDGNMFPDCAKRLMDQAITEIYMRTSLDNGLWHLSKDQFPEDSNKLEEIHFIYIHMETFIEIDRNKKVIRTFDFGYD